MTSSCRTKQASSLFIFLIYNNFVIENCIHCAQLTVISSSFHPISIVAILGFYLQMLVSTICFVLLDLVI